jgi:hypothetical protein
MAAFRSIRLWYWCIPLLALRAIEPGILIALNAILKSNVFFPTEHMIHPLPGKMRDFNLYICPLEGQVMEVAGYSLWKKR